MSTTRFRSAAALTIAGLTAAALPLLTAGTADAATAVKAKSFDYTCDVNAGGLPIPNQAIKVATTFTIPSLYQGQTVPKTKVKIGLTLPESLRQATYDLLNGRYVDGSSNDAKLTVTADGGASQSYVIEDLKAPKTAVPGKVNTPWVIPTGGVSPKIAVPAVSSVTLSMPQSFNIKATIYTKDNKKTPVTMSCTIGSADATLAKVAVRNKTTLSVSTSPRKIVAKKTKAYVSVTAKSATTPTGKVSVYNGRTKVGSGTLSKGKAKIKISAFRKKGKYTLTVKYGGDTSAVDTSVTKAVRVS